MPGTVKNRPPKLMNHSDMQRRAATGDIDAGAVLYLIAKGIIEPGDVLGITRRYQDMLRERETNAIRLRRMKKR